MRILMFFLSTMVMSSSHSDGSDLCLFNRLCTCRKSHHEVICRGIPFLHFPSFLPEGVYQVTILRSGLETLDNNVFVGSSVASLHLMQNSLVHLSPKAFAGLESILTTLDLSGNRLHQFPFTALRGLTHLQWLNLNGNQIAAIHASKWTQLESRTVVNSLFLGHNHISSVPEGAFVRLTNLEVLDMEGNLIHDVGIHPFPGSLSSLSLSGNILGHVPLHALYSLGNLRYLYLSGNLIRRLPCPFHLRAERLEKMELSNNVLADLPECVFNGSFSIKELHLEFNFLRTLRAGSLRGTGVERLVLANNRIDALHPGAFAGVEGSLLTLDLSFNLVELFPSAISSLKSLVYLSLKSNLLRFLNKSDLHGCRSTLEVLDLSGNSFSGVPKLTLKHLAKLTRVSLQDNKIHKIYRDDFQGWGKSLTTLSLANNKMTYLSAETFVHLTRLKELKLSFNNLMYLDQKVFQPLRKCLEFLDLSSAFSNSNHPLDTFVRNMERLEWLQMDHNNISKISHASTKSISKLRHVDFSNNNMREISNSLFDPSNHAFLSVVHVGSNDIDSIRSETFRNLPRLTSVVLFGNKISEVESNSFQNCPFLHSVVLSKNNISYISPSAFYNLSRLSSIYLQDNQLETFSFDIIEGETAQLYLNISNNCLRLLVVSNHSIAHIKIRTLDLTNNQISVIPETFLVPTSKYLLHLFLSKNVLTEVTLPPLPVLQVLDLSHNRLSALDDHRFACCKDVQILLLDDNHISNISDDALRNLNNLRILDVSNNRLRHLSEGVLADTKLERLNLSGNYFLVPPSPSLHKIRGSLRHLDISLNGISNISAGAFSGLHKLTALNLSSNLISFLQDMSFYGLAHLLELDLSHNALRYIEENVLAPLTSLRSLYVRNCSIVYIGVLPNPLLAVLVLKDNYLFNVSEDVFGTSRGVRHLDLSGNLLPVVPSHVWQNTRMLASLDVSNNPVEVLGIGSFRGLENLRTLDISRLLLKSLNPRTLHCLRYLTSLTTDSYASVRSFRLQDLLSQAPALRRVALNVEEQALSHQVQRAFGTKLRELVISGRNLERVLPDAFAGLTTHELTLRIGGTGVRSLPDGLLAYLPDVRYLTLDLRNNRLRGMGPGVLAAVNRDGIDPLQTQHIAGGVLLEENPWDCSCDLLWLGRWLRRWLRETFHAHMLGVEAALYVNGALRNAQCRVPGSNNSATVAIIDLRKEVRCDERAPPNGATPVPHCCWGAATFFAGLASVQLVVRFAQTFR